jgi:hypothetical protein
VVARTGSAALGGEQTLNNIPYLQIVFVVFPRGTAFIRMIGDHHKNSRILLALYLSNSFFYSVADLDSYVFGPTGSGSISTKFRTVRIRLRILL